jgi:hypothetical protein
MRCRNDLINGFQFLSILITRLSETADMSLAGLLRFKIMPTVTSAFPGGI